MKHRLCILLLINFLTLTFHCFSQNSIFQKVGKQNIGELSGGISGTDLDGNLFIGGINGAQYLIGKININGDTLWTKEFSNAYAGPVCINDSTFFLRGLSTGFGAGMEDALLIKLNSQFDTIWTRTFGNLGGDALTKIVACASGGFLLCMYVNPSGGPLGSSGDICLVRIDEDGDTLWTKTYGGPHDDGPQNFFIAKDGNYVIQGYSKGFGATPDTLRHGYLIKTDTTGNVLWSRLYLKGNVSSIFENDDGTCVIRGFAFFNNESYVTMMKTDSLGGKALWVKGYYSDTALARPWNIPLQTKDGGYLLSGNYGEFLSLNSPVDGLIIKIDSLGNVMWNMSYGTADYQEDIQGLYLNIDSTLMISANRQSIGSGVREMFLLKADSKGKTGCNNFPVNIQAINIDVDSILIIDAPTFQYHSPIIVGYAPLTITNGSGLYFDTICHGFVGVEKIQEQNFLLKVYPNPSEGKFFLERDENNLSNEKIEVYNLLGVKIFSERFTSSSSSLEINLSAYPSGIYILRCGKETKKLVKM